MTAGSPHRCHAELFLLIIVRQLEDDGQHVLPPVLGPHKLRDPAEAGPCP
jgi:hypothetical protein